MNIQIGDLLYDGVKDRIGWVTGTTKKELAPNMPWVIEWSDGLTSWHSDVIIEHLKESVQRYFIHERTNR